MNTFAVTVGLMCVGLAPPASAQPARSPLAGSRPFRVAIRPDQIKQDLTPLNRVAPVAMNGPLNARTVSSVAARLAASEPEPPFDWIEEGRFAIDEGRWVVNYKLRPRGVDVTIAHPAGRTIVLRRDGKPLLIRDRMLPRRLPANYDPTIKADAALGVALQNARAVLGRLGAGDVELKHSDPSTQVWVRPDDLCGCLMWTLTVKAVNSRVPLVTRYWIAAQDEVPKIYAILAEDGIYPCAGAEGGRVVGSVWMSSPLDPPTDDVPLDGAMVTRHTRGERTTTDEDGRFGFADPSAGSERVITALFGPHSVIFNEAAAKLWRLDGPAGVSTLRFLARTEYEIAQVSAFYWTNRAYQFTRDAMGDRLAYLPTRVNLDDSGNAYWDGFALNFFRSGNGIPNTAYADVVVHEYGHAVDARLGGVVDRAYGEGFGDALAILITGQPIVGRDFFGKGRHLRDARQVIRWNAGEEVDPHLVGQVYSGFVWRLVEELKSSGVAEPMAVAKRLVLGAAVLNPKDIPEAVRLSFIADDDDGDLGNGTPHSRQLATAADSRSIPRPSPDGQ